MRREEIKAFNYATKNTDHYKMQITGNVYMLHLLTKRRTQDMINHLLTLDIKEKVTQWGISNHTNLSSGATVWRNLTKKQIEMKILYCLNSNSIDIINCAHFTWIRTFASGRSKELSPTWKLNKNKWYVRCWLAYPWHF